MSLLRHLKNLVGGEAPAPSIAESAPAPLPPDERRLAYRHPGAIHASAASPDGAFVAVAGGGRVDEGLRRHLVFKEHFQAVMESDIVLFRHQELLGEGGKGADPAFVQKGHTGAVTCLQLPVAGEP